MDNKTLSAIIKNNIGLKNLEEGGATILASKQDKLIAGNNITINADGKTINAVSGASNGRYVYNNEAGKSGGVSIELTVGKIYSVFLSCDTVTGTAKNDAFSNIVFKLNALPTTENIDIKMFLGTKYISYNNEVGYVLAPSDTIAKIFKIVEYDDDFIPIGD